MISKHTAGTIVNSTGYTLQISNTINHLLDSDAYFAEDIPDYVSTTVHASLLREWASLVEAIKNSYAKTASAGSPSQTDVIEIRLPAPKLFYWNEADHNDQNHSSSTDVSETITITDTETSEALKVCVTPNTTSQFETRLSLSDDGEVVIYGAENSMVAWSFKLGFIEELLAILQNGLEPNSCPNCGSNNISADRPRSDDSHLFQDVTCHDCKHGWSENFSFSCATTTQGVVSEEPMACPSCGSDDIQVGSTETHGSGLATRDCFCGECGDPWTEEFKFSGCEAA